MDEHSSPEATGASSTIGPLIGPAASPWFDGLMAWAQPLASLGAARLGFAALVGAHAGTEPPQQRVLLIVDDESEVLFSYQRLLERSLKGIKVLVATSGTDGLKILRNQKVDLVLADYRMPEMDGIEFLMQARTLNPRIARMMITAFPDPDVARRALQEAEARDFVSKDLDPLDLVERIQRVMFGAAP